MRNDNRHDYRNEKRAEYGVRNQELVANANPCKMLEVMNRILGQGKEVVDVFSMNGNIKMTLHVTLTKSSKQ